MSTIDCSACNDLRNYAPNFVQNGVDSTVATSLLNGTGLNPALTVLHDNCEDMKDVLDCLIGRMKDELEAYDVCDWKDFSDKFLGNLYETLKAMVINACRIDMLCASMDNVLALLSGDCFTRHWGQRTSTWYSKVTYAEPSIEAACPFIAAAFFDGAGCREGARLHKWAFGYGDMTKSCGRAAIGVQNLAVGDELATWRKSDLVPAYMTDSWDSLASGGNLLELGVLSNDTIVLARTVEKSPGVLVAEIAGFVGNSRSGSLNGWGVTNGPFVLRYY